MLKNVVVVTDYGYIEGGAGRVAHDTALALKKQGLRVLLFCAVGPVSNDLMEAGIEVICLHQKDLLNAESKIKGAKQGIYNKKAEKEFLNLLSCLNNNETIIHAHTWTKGLSSSVFKVAKALQFKVLLTVHDYFLVCPNGGLFDYPKREICLKKPMSFSCVTCNCDSRSYMQKLFRVFRQKKQNAIIRKCDNIYYAFISNFAKEQFLKRYDKIPQDRQFFLNNPINFERNRERIHCEENDEYLFVGGLTEVKGIRVFCEAVTLAGVKATVIGQGMLEEEMKEKYPNIQFVGWKTKEEMKPYLKKTRCLIFSSIWYEVSPLTPLEIMSYGIPVICSNKNASSSYIDKEWQYEGCSAQALSGVIRKLEKIDWKSVSEKIFTEFDAEKWSEESYLENVLKCYQNILLDNK